MRTQKSIFGFSTQQVQRRVTWATDTSGSFAIPTDDSGRLKHFSVQKMQDNANVLIVRPTSKGSQKTVALAI
ncbi:hypothetical protein [Synechococcus phage BUCT-ZZ01]|nr:hypothetical protein [Synechococcus phage BUCT-ZZ01]